MDLGEKAARRQNIARPLRLVLTRGGPAGTINSSWTMRATVFPASCGADWPCRVPREVPTKWADTAFRGGFAGLYRASSPGTSPWLFAVPIFIEWYWDFLS